MSTSDRPRHALVLGATGFIGRHLVLALAEQGVAVQAAVRSEASYQRMVGWLQQHGVQAIPAQVLIDVDAARLGCGDAPGLAQVTEVYNGAGAYRFGMKRDEARHANVDTVREVVALAAGLPHLRRLVHVSGYRVGGQDPTEVPWSAERRRRTYASLGAYEASKVEADAVFQHDADQAGLPWSVVNPCTVSGVAGTGETDQFLGLAGTLHDLWRGTLSARPGRASTFVPVVPVDHLARFMTRLPVDPDSAGRSYWVLDEATPPLPELLDVVGRHYRVKVPRARVPIRLLKHLPRALTQADPETLTFLSEDRYPTSGAVELARRQGLAPFTSRASLLAWADSLAAQRFGAAAPTSLRRAFTMHAGVRTFQLGPAGATGLVLPGLPVNADTWSAVLDRLPATAAVDLPGLGMSAGGPADWSAWLDEMLTSGPVRRLVGHSIGAAAALDAAARHPGRIDQLTLVAPFFLQDRTGADKRAAVTSAYLRHAGPERLSQRLTGASAHADALRPAAADLRRGRTARHAGALLRRAGTRRWRSALQQQLSAYRGSVHLVVGSDNPLAPWAVKVLEPLGSRLRTTSIPDAGHHPQLTHPTSLATAIGSCAGSAAVPAGRRRGDGRPDGHSVAHG